MRKIVVSLFLVLAIFNSSTAFAHHCSSVYLVHKEVESEQIRFLDCNRHTMLKETTTYLYSNGQRRKIDNSTIFNQDGSIIENDCSNVKHIIYKNNHYFTFYKNRKYNIINEKGKYLTNKKYTSINEIAPNRLVVRFDKKYGIIDLNGNSITTTKYKSFEQINDNLFKTELNGYYGFIDYNGTSILENEYDKITQLYNIFLLKKEGKYGLSNNKGEIILETKFEKIKEINDFIAVKKEKLYAIFDSNGKQVTDFIYKDFKLNRNTIELKTKTNTWVTLNSQTV